MPVRVREPTVKPVEHWIAHLNGQDEAGFAQAETQAKQWMRSEHPAHQANARTLYEAIQRLRHKGSQMSDDVLQFAEAQKQRLDNAERLAMKRYIRESQLPTPIKKVLLAHARTVQFTDDGREVPSVPLKWVVDAVTQFAGRVSDLSDGRLALAAMHNPDEVAKRMGQEISSRQPSPGHAALLQTMNRENPPPRDFNRGIWGPRGKYVRGNMVSKDAGNYPLQMPDNWQDMSGAAGQVPLDVPVWTDAHEKRLHQLAAKAGVDESGFRRGTLPDHEEEELQSLMDQWWKYRPA